MGIYHFFVWFKKNFSVNIQKLPEDKTVDVKIDNLFIDMNGLFHNAAQKIYEYGSFKTRVRFINKKPKNERQLQKEVFIEVCNNIDNIFYTVNPTKRLILCVDGSAPACKMNQQRQRRFKKSEESATTDEVIFNSHSITPGTIFMDNLSKYIDWYIKKQISENPLWRDIEVIFSNEKVPCEGEGKIFSYIRKNLQHNSESCCLHGSDADLIMLSLGAHLDNFYILRDEIYDKSIKYLFINISEVSTQLSEIMRFDSEKYEYDSKNAIDDFIFLSFMLGNDFLPHIPSLEIIENGVDVILNVYRDVCTFDGHITKKTKGKIFFQKKSLKVFLEMISTYEKQILENKLKNKRLYFQDDLLESCALYNNDNGTYNLDIEKYRTEYIKKKFFSDCDVVEKELKKIAHSYLEGLQFVISYYTSDVPNWEWSYKYYYAPPAIVLAKYIDTFSIPKYEKTQHLLPFEQLLHVLPPSSSNLLPWPLCNLFIEDSSPLKEFYPDNFEIDLAGKKNDYQGILILPFVDINKIKKSYSEKKSLINFRDLKRNCSGRTFIYTYDKSTYSLSSYFGNFMCNAKVNFIDI